MLGKTCQLKGQKEPLPQEASTALAAAFAWCSPRRDARTEDVILGDGVESAKPLTVIARSSDVL